VLLKGDRGRSKELQFKDISVEKSQTLSDLNENLGFHYSTIAPFNGIAKEYLL